jgi:hypothetical protein
MRQTNDQGTSLPFRPSFIPFHSTATLRTSGWRKSTHQIQPLIRGHEKIFRTLYAAPPPVRRHLPVNMIRYCPGAAASSWSTCDPNRRHRLQFVSTDTQSTSNLSCRTRGRIVKASKRVRRPEQIRANATAFHTHEVVLEQIACTKSECDHRYNY